MIIDLIEMLPERNINYSIKIHFHHHYTEYRIPPPSKLELKGNDNTNGSI
jgi:hypothetical protein